MDVDLSGAGLHEAANMNLMAQRAARLISGTGIGKPEIQFAKQQPSR